MSGMIGDDGGDGDDDNDNDNDNVMQDGDNIREVLKENLSSLWVLLILL